MCMKRNEDLIEVLLNCAIASEKCANVCQFQNLMPRAVQLNRDCVELLKQGVRLLNHNSEIGSQFVMLIEETCRMIVEECRTNLALPQCKRCAEECTKCADECREYYISVSVPRLSVA